MITPFFLGGLKVKNPSSPPVDIIDISWLILTEYFFTKNMPTPYNAQGLGIYRKRIPGLAMGSSRDLFIHHVIYVTPMINF